ncbi:MAG: response regulator transcription factor [Acidobacteriota bacterium]
MYKVLVIEDDRAIAKALETNLRAEGYEVETVQDGLRGLDRARDPTQDLILLDLMLPKLAGEEICKTLRHEGITTPILFLTAKNTEEERVTGFELGADDYVSKPFSIRELLGRVQAILKRSAGKKYLVAHCRIGSTTVDFVKMEVQRGDELIPLTTRELAILRLMVSNEGVVISRDRLLNEVWGYDAYPTTRTVDNQIVKLRQKIEEDPENPRHILTVRGTGYKFVS